MEGKVKLTKAEDLKTKVIVIEDVSTDLDEKETKIKEKASNFKEEKPNNFKLKKHKRKRKVKLSKLRGSETLVITQEVKVKKQKIQCIVNLSNICTHPERKCVKTSTIPIDKHVSIKEPRAVDRITPHCLRHTCCSQTKRKRQLINDRKKRKKKGHTSKGNEKQANVINYSLSQFSPILSSELDVDQDISYDNISSDSLNTFMSDTELNTLIKRAKDREGKLSNTAYESKSSDCEEIPVHASTPICVDSSPEYNQALKNTQGLHSDMNMNMSPRSLETLILEPANIYSPTHPIYSPFKMDVDEKGCIENMDVNGNYG